MDNDRKEIVRKIYLSAIGDSATRIKELARRIERAKHYRTLPEVEMEDFSRSDLTLEQAGLVDHFPPLDELTDIETWLNEVVNLLGSCFEF
jgi:hypothetical protein